MIVEFRLSKVCNHDVQVIHDNEGALDAAEKELNLLLVGLDSDSSGRDGEEPPLP